MVPIILFAKPIFLFIKNKNRKQIIKYADMEEVNLQESLLSNKENNDNLEESSYIDSHQKLDMGEIMIHQIIETIEFVLGSVSNTASYLRLWALSLAHAELSKVFFKFTLGNQLASSNSSVIGIYLSYILLSLITFGVLLCIDVLECFLHTLRLHWVEFQNKFYKGSGYKFVPFDLNSREIAFK